MEKAGPPSTATETSFQDLLKTVPAPTEQAVAEVFAVIAKTSAEGSPPWNIAIIIEGLKVANPALVWDHVAIHLDVPNFEVPDAAALGMFMQAWRQATSDPFPLRALVGGLWTHATSQLSFLRQATAAPPEIFSWAHAEPRQEPLDGLHGGKSPTGTPNMSWMALDLYTTLASLAQSGHAPAVRSILESPLKACPEIFLLGAATVKGGWGPLQTELIDALVATYVSPHPNSSIVLQRLWSLNSEIILRAMSALHSKDLSTVSRSLDVCQELKALTEVLDGTSPPFCLELAALAFRREYLNLEKWLNEQFQARGVPFMQASVSFIDAKLREDVPTEQGGSTTPRLNISVGTLAVFLRSLATAAGEIHTDTLQQLKLVQAVAVQAHPELAAVISEAAVMEAFPPDVEEEANSTFQRMYGDELTVEQVVTLLHEYKNGMEARQQDVYACMVHNLFDEFRFFFKYPDKELLTTAVLFGQLVANNLVSSVSLGIALRYVLEALRSSAVEEKLFKFGVTAAKQFSSQFDEYPTFAGQLTSVAGLQQREPELFAAAEAGLKKAAATEQAKAAAVAAAAAASEAASAAGAASTTAADSSTPPPATTSVAADSVTAAASLNAAGFPTSMPAAPTTPNLLFSTINAETLEQAAQAANYTLPDAKTIDKVHFIVNNITVTNVEVKAKELATIVIKEFHPWFTNYLVVKRAAQEPNFHHVYVALVERWGDRQLQNTFVRVTVHYCKVMLGSKLLKTNSSERTLLKNLGAWLGKLTLARNRPVLQKDLDIKSTIIDAYEQGRMLPILSFVRNLLEPCSESKVFRPPNPWVMAILALLAEIYHLEGIRTSLKFEVELLFKQLDLQLADVQPGTLLTGRSRDPSDNMDFAPVKQPSGSLGTSRPGEGAAAGDKQAAAAAASGPAIDPAIIASLPNFVVVNQQLAIISERLGLKSLVGMAVERAVVEIISPVVDRSVTIACMTAHELVAKDFASEGDPEAVRGAAHLCVAGLAQSLALVTSREPLRLAVTNNLRQLLAQRLEPTALEQVVTLLVNDNLDLCCQVIERASGERAQREIDERMGPANAARTRAKAAGQQYVDTSYLQGRFPAALPDALRARPGALTQQQQRVYQDFASIPRTAVAAAAAQSPTGPQAQGPAAFVGGRPGEAAVPAAAEDPQAQLRVRFISWVQRVDAISTHEANSTLATLQDGHEAKALVAEIARIPQNEAQAVEIAKNLFFSKLYQSAPSSRMHASAYASAMAVLRDARARRLPMDISGWFAQLPDELRAMKEPTEQLIRLGMLPSQDLDMVLAKALSSTRYQPAAELLLGILQTCIIGPDPCLSTTDLPASLDILTKLAGRLGAGQGIIGLVEEARRASAQRAGAVKPSIMPQDPPQLMQTIMKSFDHWARLLEENPADRVHAAFVQELKESGLLGGEEATARYLRIMTQLAVTHCLRSEISSTPAGPRPTTLSYIAVDAYVRLMVCLITQHGGGPPLLSRVLGAVATYLQQLTDDRTATFNGRPFFRIIVGLLSELSPIDPGDETGTAYLHAISGFLFATRPLKVPSFAFPWLQLVADRRFMPRLLMPPNQQGWPAYLQLLLAQLHFLEPFLRHAELTDAVRLLYTGTLRLLLVLLHDFPEFLCQFHFKLCDAIPLSCIQMRNLVLSAFPRTMRLPDPFTQDLKVDLLAEVAYSPKCSPPADALLSTEQRSDVDVVLAGQGNASALVGAIRQRLMLTPAEALSSGTRYNAPAINGLVFYVGIKAVEASVPKLGVTPATTGTPAVELIGSLLRDLDSGMC